MNTQMQHEDIYKAIRENRMLMYSKPRRYFNRDEQTGSTFRYLFLVEALVFLLLMAAAGSSVAQSLNTATPVFTSNQEQTMNIYNYNAVYNSGKVFVSWTSKNEPEDCLYVMERSVDGKMFQSVGVKEGIGSEIELYYSWIDQNPPAGFAYYRVKKITKEGTQMYSAVNSVINQASNFDNHAQSTDEK